MPSAPSAEITLKLAVPPASQASLLFSRPPPGMAGPLPGLSPALLVTAEPPEPDACPGASACPAEIRPKLIAVARSAFRPRWISAAASTSAYGVSRPGSLASADRTAASQAAAARLAGRLLRPPHDGVPPLWYGLVMSAAL